MTLHVFCSAKGGTGKSTLAVAAAKLLADQGRACVLVDADLVGTSLADGLHLLAPQVELNASGHMDLRGHTGRFLTREETVRLRNLRCQTAPGFAECDPDTCHARAWWAQPPPPFLNDLLGGCQAVGALWRHQEEDGVGYLPASPALHDKASALGWLAGPPSDDFTWVGGFAWLLEALCAEMPTLTDVVVDLPPGLCGFAHQVLAFTSNLERRLPLPSGFPDWPAHTPLSPEYVRPGAGNMAWRCNAMLITTPDRGDLAAAAEYATRFRDELGHLRLILNRSMCVFGVLGEQYDQTVGRMRHVEEIPTLGRVFRSGGLTLTDRVRELRVPLGLGE